MKSPVIAIDTSFIEVGSPLLRLAELSFRHELTTHLLMLVTKTLKKCKRTYQPQAWWYRKNRLFWYIILEEDRTTRLGEAVALPRRILVIRRTAALLITLALLTCYIGIGNARRRTHVRCKQQNEAMLTRCTNFILTATLQQTPTDLWVPDKQEMSLINGTLPCFSTCRFWKTSSTGWKAPPIAIAIVLLWPIHHTKVFTCWIYHYRKSSRVEQDTLRIYAGA